MDAQTVESYLDQGKKVKVTLSSAKVISSKVKLVPITKYRSIYVNCLVVNDEKYGNIFLSSSSSKLFDAKFGDMITGKVMLTGLGQKNERYETPIKFSKVIRGKDGEIIIQKSIDN